MLRSASLLCASLMVSSSLCGAAESKEQKVPILKEWKGFNSGETSKQRLAIRTAQAWKAVWEKTYRNVSSPPEVPKVDFTKDMILAVFMGQKSTGGHSVQIVKVSKTDKGLKTHVREISPKPVDIVTQALTSPFHLVIISSVEGDVIFVDEKGVTQQGSPGK